MMWGLCRLPLDIFWDIANCHEKIMDLQWILYIVEVGEEGLKQTAQVWPDHKADGKHPKALIGRCFLLTLSKLVRGVSGTLSNIYDEGFC